MMSRLGGSDLALAIDSGRITGYSELIQMPANALRVQVDLRLPELSGASSASEVLDLASLGVS